MTHRYYDDGDFFLQIYTIHVNDIFQGENGEFHLKVTSLHPCSKDIVEMVHVTSVV